MSFFPPPTPSKFIPKARVTPTRHTSDRLEVASRPYLFEFPPHGEVGPPGTSLLCEGRPGCRDMIVICLAPTWQSNESARNRSPAAPRDATTRRIKESRPSLSLSLSHDKQS